VLIEGSELDGYHIDGILGQGGMGLVYEATEMDLDRKVALKVLAPDCAGEPTFRERFRREARAQAKLDHPHVVEIFAISKDQDPLYIAMKLIRGAPLKELIDQEKLDDARTLRLLGPIAHAIDTAHERGFVHRDVKPGNILVGERDHPYLADFGLIKSEGQLTLTPKNAWVGTLPYVAPEQIQGREPVEPASDIYSLTAVLYECLTREVPFPAPRQEAVIFAHLSQPPPRVTARRPELPVAIDEVIARGMAKDSSARYESACALIAAAERAIERPGTPPKRNRELMRVTHGAPVRGVAFSPDATRLASAGDDRCALISAVPTGDRVGRPVNHPRQGLRPAKLLDVAFSPRGDCIATAGRDDTARVWSLADRVEIVSPIEHAGWVRSVCFSRDGKLVATTGVDLTAHICTIAEPGELASVTSAQSRNAVQFSPDAKHLAMACADHHARVWDRGRQRELRSLPHDADVRDVAYSFDGRYLATGCVDRAARVWDLAEDGRKPACLPHDAAVWAVAFSPDGRHIATGGGDQFARVWDLTDRREVLRFEHGGVIWGVAFSPDGTQLATASDDRTARVWEL